MRTGTSLDAELKKEIALTHKILWGCAIGFAMLMLTLSATDTGEAVILTNATSSEVTVSYTRPGRNTSNTSTYRIAPGGTEDVSNVFRTPFVIRTGNTEKQYGRTEMPAAATYTVAFFGFFKERLVNATLKKDGCIFLSAAGVDRKNADAPQPMGFPHCADEEPDLPSLYARAAEEEKRKRSEFKELSSQMREWSCSVPVAGEFVRPLIALDPADTETIREARERIELLRRNSSTSWDEASWAFARIQSDFAIDYKHPSVYKLASLTKLDALSSVAGDKEFTSSYKLHEALYDNFCNIRNRGIQKMLDVEPALKSLRKESHKPWLREQNRIPCSVASVPSCSAPLTTSPAPTSLM